MKDGWRMFKHKTHRTAAVRRHVRGFTLIEMLIAITIGLGILAGLVGVLASNASNARTNDRTSELMTNGRYALNSMKSELREAGFRGYSHEKTITSPDASSWTVPPTAGTNLCGDNYATFITNVSQGVWGGDNVNPFQNNCIPANRYAEGNDVLVVRHVAASPTPDADLKVGSVYFLSTYNRGQIFRWNGLEKPLFSGAMPLGNFALQTYVYYISPMTNIDAPESPPVPALRRRSLQAGTGQMVDELVASGIERMQVQYGLREVLDAAKTKTETQYVDSPLDTQWPMVKSVRLWLLARNATGEPGYHNTNTYTMGSADQSFTVDDGFRRQLFSTVVQLRN